MKDAANRSTDPLPLRSNISWTIAGNAIYALSQWGVVVCLAKLLDADAVGRFALGLAITAPVLQLSGCNLRMVQATDARSDYRFGHYLALRLATTAGAILVILAVAFGFTPQSAPVILWVGAAKAVESISDVIYGLFASEERMDRVARSMILRGPLALAALGCVVAATESVVWGAAAMACAWGVVLAAHDLPAARAVVAEKEAGARLGPVWSVGTLRRLAWLAAPLGVVLGLLSLSANLPRYAVAHSLGEAELGIFAAIAYLIVAGTTVVNATGQAAAPRLAKHHAAGDGAAFRRLLARLILFAIAIGAAGMLLAAVVGDPLLRLVYGSEYARIDVLIWVVAAGAVSFVAMFLGFGLTAARHFRSQPALFSVTTLAVGVASYVLVPRAGLIGAAQALAIGSAVQIAGSALLLRKELFATSPRST